MSKLLPVNCTWSIAYVRHKRLIDRESKPKDQAGRILIASVTPALHGTCARCQCCEEHSLRRPRSVPVASNPPFGRRLFRRLVSASERWTSSGGPEPDRRRLRSIVGRGTDPLLDDLQLQFYVLLQEKLIRVWYI